MIYGLFTTGLIIIFLVLNLKNILIIIIVNASSEANTLKGAVITRQIAIPFICPATYVPGIITPSLSLKNAPCGIK